MVLMIFTSSLTSILIHYKGQLGVGYSGVVFTPTKIPFFNNILLREALTAPSYIIFVSGMILFVPHYLYLAHLYTFIR